MQSELSAAKEDLRRLRYQLNRAEDRIARLEHAESKKREREAREGIDMAEPDLSTPDFAEYQLQGLQKQESALQEAVSKKMNEIRILKRQYHAAPSREEADALENGIVQERRALAQLSMELETVQREIAQHKRRLGRIGACLSCDAPVNIGNSFCGKACRKEYSISSFYN